MLAQCCVFNYFNSNSVKNETVNVEEMRQPLVVNEENTADENLTFYRSNRGEIIAFSITQKTNLQELSAKLKGKIPTDREIRLKLNAAEFKRFIETEKEYHSSLTSSPVRVKFCLSTPLKRYHVFCCNKKAEHSYGSLGFLSFLKGNADWQSSNPSQYINEHQELDWLSDYITEVSFNKNTMSCSDKSGKKYDLKNLPSNRFFH